MAEYIEREAAFRANCYFCSAHLKDDSPCPEKCADYMKFVEIPAADVRPVVRGKWVPDYDTSEYDFDGITPLSEPQEFQDGWQCSLCGGYMPHKTNFCPICGADMRQKEET